MAISASSRNPYYPSKGHGSFRGSTRNGNHQGRAAPPTTVSMAATRNTRVPSGESRITTESRIQAHHLEVSALPSAKFRPTEAQLRWAQFHRSKRASKTRQQVEAFWQTPANIDEVPGWKEGDGNTTQESGSSDNDTIGSNENAKSFSNDASDHSSQKRLSPHNKQIARKRLSGHRRRMRKRRPRPGDPKISRGRRVLLRVSARATEERRAHFKENGYHISAGKINEEVEVEDDDASVDSIRDSLELNLSLLSSHEVPDEQSVFTTSTNQSSKSRRSAKSVGSVHRRKTKAVAPKSKKILGYIASVDSFEDEKRVQRFEEAYNLLWASTKSNGEQQHHPEVKTPLKRWTRGSHVESAFPADVQLRTPRIPSGRYHQDSELKDRGASWLVHLPDKVRSVHLSAQRLLRPDGTYAPPDVSDEDEKLEVLSPGQQKFDELVAILQHSPEVNPEEASAPENNTPSPGFAWAQSMADLNRLRNSDTKRESLDPMASSVAQGAAVVAGVSPLAGTADSIHAPGMNFDGTFSQYREDSSPPNSRSLAASKKNLSERWTVEKEGEGEKGKRFRMGTKVKGFTKKIFSKSDSTLQGKEVSTKGQTHADVHSLSTNYMRVVKGVSKPAPSPRHGTDKEMPPPAPTTRSTRAISPTRGPRQSLSPEQIREFNKQIVVNTKAYFDETSNSVIDTDGTTSEASGNQMSQFSIQNLMLSPTLLAKRLQQAIRAVELRKWDQVSYLTSANPWLAEMADVCTNQYLLHNLALNGAGGDNGQIPAPEKLNIELIEANPGAVHKFDNDGNLPLHMAAACANLPLTRELGKRFSSGASVRNNDGLLPLHLAIMACSSRPSGASGDGPQSVKTILNLFPGAVGVCDNNGNLPLHVAAASLSGDVGVEVVYMLLDEGERQGRTASGLKLRGTEKMKSIREDLSDFTESTTTVTDSSSPAADVISESTCINLVKNSHGNTPLTTAIRSLAGWQVVEALVSSRGGEEAALDVDASFRNALHLLVTAEYADPASILSLLKILPGIASVRNGKGVLPIETACMSMMSREVILALVLVDLPVDLDEKTGVKVREGYGGSWWFLACDCDDEHVDIVLEGCTSRDNGSVISRATPNCKQVFDALDFGTEENPIQGGRKVKLRCFSKEAPYLEETALLQKKVDFDRIAVEDIFNFCVHEYEGYASSSAPKQFCIAVEQPSTTLARIVDKFTNNPEYRAEREMFNKYLSKVGLVLRIIAKTIKELHARGIVHGNIGMRTCGKFGDEWKLMESIGCRMNNEEFQSSHLNENSPPEAVDFREDKQNNVAIFRSSLPAHYSVDLWAFGKLAFEVLVGEPLIPFDSTQNVHDDSEALAAISSWNETDLRQVIRKLEDTGMSSLGADMITHCLCANPIDRPESIDEVLNHPFWRDTKRKATQQQKLQSASSISLKSVVPTVKKSPSRRPRRRFAA
eukprot:scaffold38298_cov49-Attheya_sp.AAC.1